MVRRAVLKDWKPLIFGMFFFTRISYSAIAFRIMGSLRNFRSSKLHTSGQNTFKPENLRQARFAIGS
ncbi:hypothetical protein BBL07_20660 [Agrobacterium vitis]|nr:hypothetical protein BBL07_20660 [Agrobacterium vitis]